MDRKNVLIWLAVASAILVTNIEGGSKKIIIHVPYKVKKVNHVHTIIKTIHHHHTHQEPQADANRSPSEEHEHFHHLHVHGSGSGQHSQRIRDIHIPEFLPDPILDVPLKVPDLPQRRPTLPKRSSIPLYRREVAVSIKSSNPSRL